MYYMLGRKMEQLTKNLKICKSNFFVTHKIHNLDQLIFTKESIEILWRRYIVDALYCTFHNFKNVFDYCKLNLWRRNWIVMEGSWHNSCSWKLLIRSAFNNNFNTCMISSKQKFGRIIQRLILLCYCQEAKICQNRSRQTSHFNSAN